MYRRVLPYLTIVVVLACNVDNTTQPPPPLPTSASSSISDGAHLPGNPDFFFVSPTLPNPKNLAIYGDNAFNANLLPLVTVCELNLPNVENDGAVQPGTPCKDGPPVASFQLTASNVDPVAEKYQVDWMVPVAAPVYYRIQVFVGSTRLGFADVKTGPTPQSLKGTNANNFITRVDGSDLPIKFRIEEFALCDTPGTGPCSSETVNLTTGGEVSTTFEGDDHPTGVDIQPASGAGSTTITIEECTDLNPRVTDLPTYGRCARVTADPPLTAPLAQAAVVFICNAVDDIGTSLSAAQRSRVSLHRFDESEGVGDPDSLTALPHVDPEACDAPPPSFGLGHSLKGMLADLRHGRFKSAGGRFTGLLSPKPLYAAVLDEGGGGLSFIFSDFQFALPAKMEKVASTDNQVAPPGTLATSPKVIVTDLAGDPVANARVRFGGTTEAACLAVPVEDGVMSSDIDGSASKSWTISQGSNTLVACGRGIADADESTNGPRAGFDPFQPIQTPFDAADPPGGPVEELVLNGSVTFSATGVIPIRVSGFNELRNRAPLMTSGGAPGSESSTLVAALNNSSNFGSSGIVACQVTFQPFVQTITPGSLVDGGNRLVDVFFAGLTGTDLTNAEAGELAAFVNAGGMLFIAGNSGVNEGPSYHPLFTALGATTTYNATIVGPTFGNSSDPSNTLFTNGPFGAVGPLRHTPFRGIQAGSMTGLATGEGTTEQILVEGQFGTGRLSAMGDPLYFNLFTDVDSDNLNYFLNLFAAGCSVPPPGGIDN